MQHLIRWALPLALCAGVSAASTDTRLIDAVKTSRSADITALIAQHADVNGPDVDGSTPLHWAAYRGDLETARVLLAAGAHVSVANRYGVTPLSLACQTGNAAVVRALLLAGADANTASPEGETVLMTASRTGSRDAVDELLRRGADPNAREGWRRQTALMWAASAGHTAVVHSLLDYGADVSARSGADVSASGGAGASLGTRATGTGGRTGGGAGLTSLLFAVRAGHIETTKALLDAGADVNDRSPDGTAALMVAILNAHFELAATLLERGANPKDESGGMAPLHLALQIRNPDWDRFPDPKPTGAISSLDLIDALLAKGADPNVRTSKRVQGITGVTPFILAAKAADLEAMRLLVSRGADAKLAAADGTTALMAAAGLGYTEGKTRTTEGDAVNAVKALLDSGADVNAVNNTGDTALHGAATRGANEVVKLLVARGARIDVKNKKGLTPLDATETVAEGKTVHADTAQLLRELAAR